jgi:hypothetical protein
MKTYVLVMIGLLSLSGCAPTLVTTPSAVPTSGTGPSLRAQWDYQAKANPQAPAPSWTKKQYNQAVRRAVELEAELKESKASK